MERKLLSLWGGTPLRSRNEPHNPQNYPGLCTPDTHVRREGEGGTYPSGRSYVGRSDIVNHVSNSVLFMGWFFVHTSFLLSGQSPSDPLPTTGSPTSC